MGPAEQRSGPQAGGVDRPDDHRSPPPSSADPEVRPPQSRVWTGATVLADDADEPEVADLLHRHQDACAWAVVESSDTVRIGGVVERFGLDRWVRRDLMPRDVPAPTEWGRPSEGRGIQVKYEELERVRLVITAVTELSGLDDARGALAVRQLSLVITPRLLLVVAQREDLEPLCRHLDNLQEQLTDGGAERAAQAVLHAVNSYYFTVVHAITTTSDELADSLFDLQPLSRAEKATAFRLRRAVTQLRQITEPMREVVQSLGESSNEVPGGISRSWNLLIEHQNWVAGAADDLRDSLGALFDTSLAFDDSRMNEVMKKLTGWAAIVAVPTLVTGFAGMNVPYWLVGKSTGFYVYLVIMLIGVVSLYIVFKRKEWI